MADIVSLLIEGAIAATSIVSVFIGVYAYVRPRREAQRRELFDRIYVPMRRNAEAWQNPEPLFPSVDWSTLKANIPYLTARVPSKLKKQFDRAQAIVDEMAMLSTPLDEALQIPTARDSGRITIWKETTTYANFNLRLLLFRLLKTGQTLRQFAREHMMKIRPDVKDWEIGYSVASSGASSGVGSTEEAENHVATTLRMLESKSEAIKFRSLFKELVEIGRSSQEQLDKELRKRVAAVSPSPAKEPGNPFG